jgi:hypothetical protein
MPFSVVSWSPLAAHPRLVEDVQPVLQVGGEGIQDGTPPALWQHMCTIAMAPPGATQRLHVAPKDTHTMFAQVRAIDTLLCASILLTVLSSCT